jgi:hypothetical protein
MRKYAGRRTDDFTCTADGQAAADPPAVEGLELLLAAADSGGVTPVDNNPYGGQRGIGCGKGRPSVRGSPNAHLVRSPPPPPAGSMLHAALGFICARGRRAVGDTGTTRGARTFIESPIRSTCAPVRRAKLLPRTCPQLGFTQRPAGGRDAAAVEAAAAALAAAAAGRANEGRLIVGAWSAPQHLPTVSLYTFEPAGPKAMACGSGRRARQFVQWQGWPRGPLSRSNVCCVSGVLPERAQRRAQLAGGVQGPRGDGGGDPCGAAGLSDLGRQRRPLRARAGGGEGRRRVWRDGGRRRHLHRAGAARYG